MREKGIDKTESELQIHELYNRYFFFRKEEIETEKDDVEGINMKESSMTPTNKLSQMSQSMGHVNINEFKS